MIRSLFKAIYGAAAAGFLAALTASVVQASVPVESGPTYRYQSWNVAAADNGRMDMLRGLPQISARAIVRAPDGLLWIGTEGGIARFDGLDFEVFNTRNTPELKSSWIDDLWVDRGGRIWVSASDGILVFEHNQFRRVLDAQEGFNAVAIAEATDGTLWFGGDRLWSVINDEVTPADFYDGNVIKLVADGNDLWWISRRRQIAHYQDGELEWLDSSLWGGAEAVDLDLWRGDIYVSTAGGLYRLQRNNNRWTSVTVNAPERVAFTAPAEDFLFVISTSGQMYTVDGSQRKPIWRRIETPMPVPLDANPVATYVAAGDSLWLGTKTAGLHNFWVSHIEREGRGVPELYDAPAWSFFVDETVYVGTDRGLFRRRTAAEWDLVVSPSDIDGGVAYSYWQDATGQYLGTRSGLYLRKPDDTQFSKVSELGERQINSIVPKGEHLWIATGQGLFDYSPADRRLTLVEAIGDRRVRAVVAGSADSLWIATEAGLMHLESGVAVPVKNEQLQTAFTASMVDLGDGWLAVGTYGLGLFVRSPDGDWTQYDSEDGLAFQSMFSLLVHEDLLWVGANRGVMRLDISTLKQGRAVAEVLHRDDGVHAGRNNLPCCNGAGHRRSVIYDGKLFLPTLSGVVTVRMDAESPKASIPIVKAVWHRNQRLTYDGVVRLEENQRDIEITFAAPQFSSEELPEFRYRLLPGQEDWIYPNGRKLAQFTNLDPDAAIFELEARIGTSEWKAAAPLKLYVKPYFYETWFAKALVVIALALLFFAVLRFRTRQLEIRANDLALAVEQRTADAEAAKKAMEDTARDSQRIIRDANAPILTIAENGVILDWNHSAEKLAGWTLDEVVGNPITDILTETSPPLDPEGLFKRLGDEGTIDNLRVSFLNRRGRRVTLLLGGTRLPSFRHLPERLVLVGQDLTEYLEREQQLIQASKMSTLGEMATGMAHELNQPLNSIKLAVTNIMRTMERKPDEMDGVPRKLQRISEQVDRAAKIIDHLRLYGRRSGTPGSVDKVDFDPHVPVQDAISMFREQLVLESIDLQIALASTVAPGVEEGLGSEASPSGIEVTGDPLLLEQVLMNLIGNARDAIRDHAPPGSPRWIRVGTAIQGSRIVIDVEDSGGGVSEDVLTNMFQPFFTTKDPGKGTGLGLSIAYTSIRNMGGDIVAQNAEHGLRVSIDLPLVVK